MAFSFKTVAGRFSARPAVIAALALSSIFFALFTAGCITDDSPDGSEGAKDLKMMVAQYRIFSIATIQEERTKLMDALANVASQAALEEVTHISQVQNTLVLYSQPKVAQSKVDLGARVVGDDVIVDLIGGYGPETPSFKQAKSALLKELKRSFPGQYDQPSPRIPVFREEPNPAPAAAPAVGSPATQP
ncbi:MAG TPA: hypothetical protein VK717_11245 [Opitutaceae bacterium]|jgi:hypothetical protein|nr:hypothetical protein [Opitutaceae bacterium]